MKPIFVRKDKTGKMKAYTWSRTQLRSFPISIKAADKLIKNKKAYIEKNDFAFF